MQHVERHADGGRPRRAHGMGQVADAVDGDRNRPRRRARRETTPTTGSRRSRRRARTRRGRTGRRRAVGPRPARRAAAVVSADASAEPPNVSRRHHASTPGHGERGHDRQRMHDERGGKQGERRRAAHLNCSTTP